MDKLIPGQSDIIASAEHDHIYLGVSAEELAKVITPEQILDLVRCGVMYDQEGYLYMFA